MGEANNTLSRRSLIIGGITLAAGVAVPIAIRSFSESTAVSSASDLEKQVLADFLKPGSELTRDQIEPLLFDVTNLIGSQKKRFTRARAIHLGDGFFLSNYHVIDPNEIEPDTTLVLTPQSRRHHVYDFRKPFTIYSYDEKMDLALLKTEVEKTTGKALVHLTQYPLKDNDTVSIFFRFSGPTNNTGYEFTLVGVDYYDRRTRMELGKIIVKPNSSLIEFQGRVIPYHPKKFQDIPGSQGLEDSATAYLSSIVSHRGYSGSPVFLQTSDGKYQLASIASGFIRIVNEIPTPGNPLYDSTPQTATVFPKSVTIANLVNNVIMNSGGKQ